MIQNDTQIHVYTNIDDKPLVLDPKDWSDAEFKTLCKLFGCVDGTTHIEVSYKSITSTYKPKRWGKHEEENHNK